ncbi:unnamed protein product [Onchocerca flexuosa]|uniref:ABC transporter domain-containing protein n=1 Tax=Onchocerca flexuosa TaxID=387005 RepID=A0A183HMP8_9BILA|nr:unnamed protein product [Onchocerca flexuosa]
MAISVRAGRTTITVAHRLSTIRNADQIIVFKDGEIMEMGLHNELMELDGIYRQIVQAQKIEKGNGELINHDESMESLLQYQSKNNKQQLKEKKSLLSVKSLVTEKDHKNKK